MEENPNSKRVLVSKGSSGKPEGAEDIQFMQGDILIEYDGKPLHGSIDALIDAIREALKKTTIVVSVARSGKFFEFLVEPGPLDVEFEAVIPPPMLQRIRKTGPETSHPASIESAQLKIKPMAVRLKNAFKRFTEKIFASQVNDAYEDSEVNIELSTLAFKNWFVRTVDQIFGSQGNNVYEEGEIAKRQIIVSLIIAVMIIAVALLILE